MKAAIGIDEWKLPIFKRHLDAAGYEWVNAGNLTPDTLILTVMSNDKDALEKVVRAANLEAATRKGDRNGRNNTH